MDAKPQLSGLKGLAGRGWETAQIYEGTNQIQRIVIARQLLK